PETEENAIAFRSNEERWAVRDEHDVPPLHDFLRFRRAARRCQQIFHECSLPAFEGCDIGIGTSSILHFLHWMLSFHIRDTSSRRYAGTRCDVPRTFSSRAGDNADTPPFSRSGTCRCSQPFLPAPTRTRCNSWRDRKRKDLRRAR